MNIKSIFAKILLFIFGTSVAFTLLIQILGWYDPETMGISFTMYFRFTVAIIIVAIVGGWYSFPTEDEINLIGEKR